MDSGTAATEALTATEPVDETVLAVASTTGFVTPGQKIYAQDASVVADGEWRTLREYVSNTSVTILDGLEVQKDSSDFIWSNAEVRPAFYDLVGVERIRLSFLHDGATGANVHIMAVVNFHDDYSSV